MESGTSIILAEAEPQREHSFWIGWDHSSDDGERMGPGVYFYRVEAGPFRDRKKMDLLAN